MNPLDPKAAEGVKKTQLHLLPPIALAEAAKAHRQGSERYGPYNWRHTKVCASTYISAMMRHLDLWRDGEDLAPDSGVSHLGHIIASANILLDAAHCGTLVDDRAKVPDQTGFFQEALAEAVEDPDWRDTPFGKVWNGPPVRLEYAKEMPKPPYVLTDLDDSGVLRFRHIRVGDPYPTDINEIPNDWIELFRPDIEKWVADPDNRRWVDDKDFATPAPINVTQPEPKFRMLEAEEFLLEGDEFVLSGDRVLTNPTYLPISPAAVGNTLHKENVGYYRRPLRS